MSSAFNRTTALVWCSSVDPAGGMERVALSIANGLAGAGWRVLLAGPFSRAPLLRRAIRPEVEFFDSPPGKSIASLWRSTRFLSRIVRQRQVDVISAHGSVFPVLPVRVPVVWTEHDLRYGGREMLRGMRGLAWRRVRARLRQGRWQLVTVSRHVHNEVCHKLDLPKGSGRVIYNGLPNAEALRSLPAPKVTPPYQIGFLGRLVPSKRPLDVFELSGILNRMGVDHVWHVFGDGVLLPEMRTAAARDGHSVRLHGLAESAQEAFSRIDLLAFLARGEQEGLGMVLLEAIAAKRLVVAWDAGCIREVLAGRGVLVHPAQPLEAFAGAIASTLRQGRPPGPEQDDRWGEARMIADYDAILSEAVRSRARGAR
jgi:glycosyltransferase involved in cell wall biosynthesis